MGVSVTIEDIRLREALQKVEQLTKRSMGSIVKEQARLLAKRLTDLTYPQNKAQGSKRVAIDIGRVYMANTWFEDKFQFRNQKLGERIKKLVREKDSSDLQTVFQNSSRLSKIHIEPFDAARHANARRKGRINFPNPNSFPLNEQAAVKRYVKEKQKNVGLAKAGWGKCLSDLSGKVASWLVRDSAGAVEDKSDEPNPSISITNKVGYFSDLDAKANIVGRAMQGRATDMVKAAERAIERAAREATL